MCSHLSHSILTGFWKPVSAAMYSALLPRLSTSYTMTNRQFRPAHTVDVYMARCVEPNTVVINMINRRQSFKGSIHLNNSVYTCIIHQPLVSAHSSKDIHVRIYKYTYCLSTSESPTVNCYMLMRACIDTYKYILYVRV